MRAMKDQSDQNLSLSGKELAYDQYWNLLLSVATNYDTQLFSSSGQISRKLYVTEADNYNFSRDSIPEVTEENIDCDIDASASTFLISLTNKSPNTCMPREDSSSISPEVR